MGGEDCKERSRYSASLESARVRGGRCGGKAQAEESKQVDGGVRNVGATMQIAQAVESLDGQSQHQQEPTDKQAIGIMMSDVFEAVAILGVVETLVFDFPPRLGHPVQAF